MKKSTFSFSYEFSLYLNSYDYCFCNEVGSYCLVAGSMVWKSCRTSEVMAVWSASCDVGNKGSKSSKIPAEVSYITTWSENRQDSCKTFKKLHIDSSEYVILPFP